MALVFILPAAIGFLVFYLYPFFRGFYFSLTRYNLLGTPHFIGLGNFTSGVFALPISFPEDEVITQAPRAKRQRRAKSQAAAVQQTPAQALAAEAEYLGTVRTTRAPRSRMVAGKWVTPTDQSGIAYLQKLIEGGVRNVSREREHGFNMRGVKPGAAATTQNPTRAAINEENAQMQRGLEALRRQSFSSQQLSEGKVRPEDASSYAGFLGGLGLRQGMSRPGRGMVQMRRGLSLAGGPANKRALSLAAKGYVLANNAYLAGDYEEAQGLANTAIDVLKTASPEWRRRLGKSANKTRFDTRQYTDEADMEGFLASTGMDLPVMLQGLTNSITSAVSAAPKVMEVTNKKGKTRLVMTGNANARVRKAAGGRKNRKGGMAGGTSISAGRVAASDFGSLLKASKRPKKELSEDEAAVAARPETPEQIRARLGMPSPEELQAKDTLAASLQDRPISTKTGSFRPAGADEAIAAARIATKAKADAASAVAQREEQLRKQAKKTAAVAKKNYAMGEMGGLKAQGPPHFLSGDVSEIFDERTRDLLGHGYLFSLLHQRASGGWMWNRMRRAEGGLLGRMLSQTIMPGSARIRPGHEAESQRLNLLMEQKNQLVGATLMGEKGPEILTAKGEVIPYHDSRFPSQMRRRAEGGQINVMGPKGKGFISPSAATGFVKGFGEILRVFVVNWPAMTLGGATGEGGHINEPRASSRAGTVRAGSLADKEKPDTKGTGTLLGATKVSASPETALGRRASIESVGLMRSRLTDVQTGVSEALQMAPARAITTAMTQIAMNTFGGRTQLIARANEVKLSANKAQSALGAYQKSQRKVINAEQEIADEATSPARKAALKKSLEGDKGLRAAAKVDLETYEYRAMVAESQLHGSRTFLKQAKALGYDMKMAEAAAAEGAGAEIPGGRGGGKRPYGTGGAVTKGIMGRALGVGTASALGAGVLFSLGLQATGEIFGLFGAALKDAANTLTHFSASASMATAALAPAAVGAPAGQPRAAILGQLARLGVGPQAAATSLFTPIIQASQGLAAAQQAQTVSGLMRGSTFYGSRGMNGPIPGLGGDLRNGVLGTFVNQTPSIGETIGGDLARMRTEGSAAGRAGMGSNLPFPWLSTLINGPTPPPSQSAIPDYINYLNETARTGGHGGGPQLKLSGDKLLVEATIDSFNKVGATQMAQSIKDSFAATGQAYALNGPGGATAYSANQYLQNYGTGLVTGNPQQMWDSMQPQLAAQMAIQQRQAQFQRDRVMPTQLGWQLFQNRQITPGAGTPGGGALPITGEMQRVLQDIADKAQIEIKATVPPETYQTIDRFATYMKNERERVLKESAGLALDQYNYQLKIATRSAGDLLGLAGMQTQSVQGQVVAVTELGKLQREQLNIGRESQRLEIAHSQRQINFNTALSQLSVAGETPAERAARLRDAQIENKYSQQQLNLTKQGFNVGVKIENITIDRQAQDALKNLEFFKRNWAVQLDTTKLTEAETAAQGTLGYLSQIGQTYTDSVLAGESMVNEAAGSILLQTGQWGLKLDDMPGKYENINNAAKDLLTTLQNPLLGGTNVFNPNSLSNQSPHAAGGLFSTTGPTNMLVGEAGTETVAVLRNPRQMQNPFTWNAPAGFGQTAAAPVMVNINFNGPVNVRDDSDLDRLARKVEQMMNQRARSVGVAA
jgi:hypothetical protein